eukprot:jgi/Botrbrau1/16549/Bobra.0256s0008.1
MEVCVATCRFCIFYSAGMLLNARGIVRVRVLSDRCCLEACSTCTYMDWGDSKLNASKLHIFRFTASSN